MTTLETTHTQPHTTTHPTNTELRDRWRALAGLTQPQYSTADTQTYRETHSAEADLAAGQVTVASPSRITVGSWGLSGPIA